MTENAAMILVVAIVSQIGVKIETGLGSTERLSLAIRTNEGSLDERVKRSNR